MKPNQRRKLGFPTLLLVAALSFILGFSGSLFFSHGFSGGGSRRGRLMEVGDGGFVGVPHGITGETEASEIVFQVLTWKPRAVYFPNFASREECRAIIDMAKPNLGPSILALRKWETAESTKGIRTSSGTFISASEDKTGVLAHIEEKISRATMIPVENGEAFNILRYEIGQRYASHYDAFDPAEYGPVKIQRVASFLLYLSDVEEGGETIFPYEDGHNMDIGYDYEKCIGLKVKPRQGDGLLFHSLYVNGTIDLKSLHGSCPVIKGEKWVATKWLNDQVQKNG